MPTSVLDYPLKHRMMVLSSVVSKSKKFFKIQFHDGKEDTVSTDRLKPAYEINYDEYGENDGHSSLDKIKALVSILKKNAVMIGD